MVANPSSGSPRSVQSLSELLPLPTGWTPAAKSGVPATSLRRGRGPRQRVRPLKPGVIVHPAEPRGAGTQGGLCSIGAGPGRPVCVAIGSELRTGGWASRAGPTPLAMSSACCTPNLSIYSTGIEAVGAALAPANHGWDFLFRSLFVSLWDLRRCHRFQGVPRE